MRRIKEVCFFASFLTTIGTHVFGQSFTNLNFEQAKIVPDPSSSYYPNAVYASSAIPGWTPVGFLGSDINYNDTSLGAPDVELYGKNDMYGPNSLDGNYSIGIYGGGGYSGFPTGASISQTAVVPADALSIRFIAQGELAPQGSLYGGPLLVSLQGQNIPITVLSTSSAFMTFGGDVSAFAGQLSQLTIDAPLGVNNYWEIDDITFSPLPIPEPSTLSFSIGGILVLLWRVNIAKKNRVRID